MLINGLQHWLSDVLELIHFLKKSKILIFVAPQDTLLNSIEHFLGENSEMDICQALSRVHSLVEISISAVFGQKVLSKRISFRQFGEFVNEIIIFRLLDIWAKLVASAWVWALGKFKGVIFLYFLYFLSKSRSLLLGDCCALVAHQIWSFNPLKSHTQTLKLILILMSWTFVDQRGYFYLADNISGFGVLTSA